MSGRARLVSEAAVRSCDLLKRFPAGVRSARDRLLSRHLSPHRFLSVGGGAAASGRGDAAAEADYAVQAMQQCLQDVSGEAVILSCSVSGPLQELTT